MAFMTLPDATRVAIPLASAGNSGMSASQPTGNWPRRFPPSVRDGGKLLGVGADALPPGRLGLCATLDRFAKTRERLIGDQERRLGRPAEILLRQPHLVVTERRSMRFERIMLVGRSVADVSADEDQ